MLLSDLKTTTIHWVIYNCIFSSSSSGFKNKLIRQKGDLFAFVPFIIKKNGKKSNNTILSQC